MGWEGRREMRKQNKRRVEEKKKTVREIVKASIVSELYRYSPHRSR